MSVVLLTLGHVTEPLGPPGASEPGPRSPEPAADQPAFDAEPTATTAYPLPDGWPVPPGWTQVTVPDDPRTFVIPPPDTTGTGSPPGLRQPVPATAERVDRKNKLVGRLFGTSLAAIVVLAVAAGSTFLVTGWLIFQVWGFDQFGATVEIAVITFLVTGGHTAASLWAAQNRPVRWWAIAVTQVPFFGAYLVAIAWYHSRGVIIDKTGFPPLYILWAAAAPSALAWLIIWYTRNPQPPRRAIAFLIACAILVVVNGAGIFTILWRDTNGFGLVGPPSPWDALDGLVTTSCISNSDFYFSGSKQLQANCPSGPTADLYSGIHDKAAFDQLLCGDQPRAAFQTWWNRSRHYQIAITLDFGYPTDWKATIDGKPAEESAGQVGGSNATITVTVGLQAAFRIGGPDDQAHPMHVDKGEETWHVQLEHQLLGGWKVCHIDVPDPIKDHPALQDPKPSPSPSDDDPLGRRQLASQLPCGPLDPLRQLRNCPSDSPSPSPEPSTTPAPTPAPTSS